MWFFFLAFDFLICIQHIFRKKSIFLSYPFIYGIHEHHCCKSKWMIFWENKIKVILCKFAKAVEKGNFIDVIILNKSYWVRRLGLIMESNEQFKKSFNLVIRVFFVNKIKSPKKSLFLWISGNRPFSGDRPFTDNMD